MIVVDASVLVNALADDDDDRDLARSRLLADPDLHAPSLVDLMLALTQYPHLDLVSGVWALRDNLTPYDGAYVAPAETLGCPLVTSDERLARASDSGCPVELLG